MASKTANTGSLRRHDSMRDSSKDYYRSAMVKCETDAELIASIQSIRKFAAVSSSYLVIRYPHSLRYPLSHAPSQPLLVSFAPALVMA